jgi:hypothetical protein
MSLRPVATTLLLACALSIGTVPLGSATAFAQSDASRAVPVRPTAQHKPGVSSSAQKKAPGKVCGEFASNTQAHKDCIARQAKMDKTAKDTKKLKAEKTPKRS